MSIDGDFMRTARDIITRATDTVARLDLSDHDRLLDAAAIFRSASAAIDTERSLCDALLYGSTSSAQIMRASEAQAQFDAACEEASS